MIKEKHVLTNPYNHHALSRYIDVYEVSANRCHSVPESGYKGTEATLVNEPAWNEKFSSYSITGATLTGNNFILNNDVTAQAIYETAKNVTTINCDSTKNSGFIGDTASLSNTPAWNEKFISYSMTGSTLTGNNFSFTGSDITAQANFETAKNVTLQTDGHGSIVSTKNSGFIGDTAALSNTPNKMYTFANYSITGATLTGNSFTFTGSDITAKANFNIVPYKTLYTSTATISTTGNYQYNVDISEYPFTIINTRIKRLNGAGTVNVGTAHINFIFNNASYDTFANNDKSWWLRRGKDVGTYYPAMRTVYYPSPAVRFTATTSYSGATRIGNTYTYFSKTSDPNSGSTYTFCIDRSKNVCELFIEGIKMGSGGLVAGNIFNGIRSYTEQGWIMQFDHLKVYGCTAESQVSGVLTGGVPG